MICMLIFNSSVVFCTKHNYCSHQDMNGMVDSVELAKIFRRINYAIKRKESDSLCKKNANINKPVTKNRQDVKSLTWK